MNKYITIAVLLILVTANAIYVGISDYFGPIIALILYGVVGFIVWRFNHFQAGIIAGALGLVIHIYELVPVGLADMGLLNQFLFMINLILPIPLIYFSYKSGKQHGMEK